MIEASSELLRRRQFLEKLGISEGSERRGRTLGEAWPPHLMINQKIYYRRFSVAQWLAEQGSLGQGFGSRAGGAGVSRSGVRFEGRGLSASRVRQAHQLVGAVLRFAVRAKYLAANPAEGSELPVLPDTEHRYLTQKQLNQVAVASGRLRTLVLVLGYCGLRFSEVVALRVADVDLDGHRTSVRRKVTYVRKTGLVEGPTKNHTNRTVPVPAIVAGMLKTETSGKEKTTLVFPSARGGGYLTLGQGRYGFQKATAAVEGCDGVRIHDLRHTCASLAISSGGNIKVVQKLLGHKSAVLTLDRHGHLFPDDLDAVAAEFDAAARNYCGLSSSGTRLTDEFR
ncbi:MAG: tyrosine-type recombinase/integrase [Mycobacterium sp.]